MKHKSITSTNYVSTRGYVLVMTLVLVVMAGSVLAVMARRSMFDASDTLHAQERLQQKWSVYSLSRSILPQAGKVMDEVIKQFAEKPNDPTTRVQFDLTMGQNTWTIVLSDEQAKANLNQLLKTKGNSSETSQAIRSLAEKLKVSDLPTLQVKPFDWKDTNAVQSIHTWDQVVEEVLPEKLYATESDNIALADMLTCWGDGKLNLRNTPGPVMEIMCLPLLGRGQIEKIISERKANPQLTLEQAIKAADIAKDQVDKIKPLFTDASTCYSLFLSVDQARMKRHWLIVGQKQKTKQTADKTSPNVKQNDKLILAEFQW